MHDARSDFDQRFEHKRARVHPRMREDRVRAVANYVAVKQYVQVDSARTVEFAPNTSQALLDLTECAEQVFGIEVGLQFDGGVEIRPLSGWTANGVRFVIARDLADRNPGRLAKRLQRPIQIAP